MPSPVEWLSGCYLASSDGRIAEAWVVSDALGMISQLGLVPAPGRT